MGSLGLLPDWLSAEGLFNLLGPWALIGFTVVIFVECAIFLGMFFPGDSLLFLTGMLVAAGDISEPLWLVLLVLYLAAILGNVVGYHVGAAVGPKLFNRPDSRLLKPEHVQKTHDFFEKYGARSIILARFVPIVRSLITAVAGIAGMDQRKFYLYSAIGAVFWVIGVVLLGVALGQVAFVRDNLEAFLIGFVVLSTIPIFVELRHHRAR